MKKVLNLIQNRNAILISALIIAFLFPEPSKYLKEYTIYILGIVMIFSTTGIKFSMLKDMKSFLKVTFQSFILNYLIFGTIILGIAYFVFDETIFNGFVVIAATPPGVAIIPFSFTFKGDLDYSFRGILGTYLLSILLAPLIIAFFTEGVTLNPTIVILVIVKIIVVPIILSRFLLIKKVYPITEKVRGKIVDWGFALIIYIAIAINRNIIFSDLTTVFKSTTVLIIAIFISGIIYLFLTRKTNNKQLQISKNLMLTIKSSGFAIAVTIILFEEKSAIPAAVMSILVLLWLISLNVYYSRNKKI